MLHHLKLTVRRLLRHSSITLINMLGLSIGIAACLLIYLYVHNELTYDAYNLNKDRIARVTCTFHSPESDLILAITPVPLAAALARGYPEVERSVRLESTEVIMRQGKELLKEEGCWYSEQAVFSVFTFTFLEGSGDAALTNPGSVVLTRSMEKKYFGTRQALNQTLIIDGNVCKVTAVIADRPANSDMEISALMYKDYSKSTDWVGDDFTVMTFVLFRQKPGSSHPEAHLKSFEGKLKQLAKYTQPQLEAAGAKGYRLSFQAEMLGDLHFSTGKLADSAKGDRTFNTIFSVLAFFILLIALLNYINLSTTKAIERAKEVGVRKVIGARPVQLIAQFLGESSLLIFVTLVIAAGLSGLFIPLLNKSLGIHLTWGGWDMFLFLLLLFPVVAVGGGLYPAFVLSRYQPVKVLKGNVSARGFTLRKILSVIQFVIALSMLTGTAVIYSQMQYVAHKDLGADRTGVVCIQLAFTDSLLQRRSKAFCEALKHENGVGPVSVGGGLPNEGVSMASTTVWSDKGQKREMMCRYFMIDPQFVPLLKIGMAAGRNLSDSLNTDKTEAFLVNEAFVRKMGWKHPVGMRMEGSDNKGKVVGVVRNFFYSSLHNAIEPAAMVYTPPRATAALVKISPAQMPRIRELWKSFFPERPFDSFYLDEAFMEQYAKDRMMMFMFNAFTLLSLLISCLGLYGLVTLISIQRTKEIGIRKVLGASLFQLVGLQSKSQLALIGWAALIALPLAGLGGQRWLETYAWHTHMNIGTFLWPMITILILALSVTSLRVLRSARTNPVKSLKSE